MKTVNPIERIIMSPVSAVIFCAGGACALWYALKDPEVAPKANLGAVQAPAPRAAIDRRSEPDPSRRRNSVARDLDDARDDRAVDPNRRRNAAVPEINEAQRRRTGRVDFGPRERQPDQPRMATGRWNSDSQESEGSKEPPVSSGESIATTRSEPGADVTKPQARMTFTSDANGSRAPLTKAALENAPKKAAVGGQQGPEELLAGRRLRKAKTYYVVPTEDEINREFNKVRPAYSAMDVAMGQVKAALYQDAYVNALDNERIGTETYMTNLNLEMGNLPNTAEGRAMRQQMQNDLFACRIYLTNVNGELAMARKLLATPVQKEVFWRDFVQTRAAFQEASKGIRPFFDKAAGEYIELQKDAEVKEALRILSERTRAPLLLGPSKDYKAALTFLRNANAMVSFDPASYKVKPKIKSVKQKKP